MQNPGKPTHRQLRKLQIAIEKVTGERFSFLEVTRAAIKHVATESHMGKRMIDYKVVHSLGVKARQERERQRGADVGDHVWNHMTDQAEGAKAFD